MRIVTRSSAYLLATTATPSSRAHATGLFKNWRQAQLSQLAYVLHPETYLNRDVIAVQGTSVDRYW
jgi:hypothetical protein